MGYFSAAIVFREEPAWDALGALPAPLRLRGYYLPDGPLWFLDFWSERKPPGFPFTRGFERDFFSEVPGDQSIERLEHLCQNLEGAYGARWLRLANEVARLTDCEVYFFAADDEYTDMGALVRPGGTERFQAKFEMAHLELLDGRFQLTPQIDASETDQDLPSPIPEGLRELSYLTILPPQESKEADLLYGNALACWPQDYGNPETLLGLGTFDPFVEVAGKLELQYERVPQIARKLDQYESTPRSAWVRFWGWFSRI